MWRWSRPGPGRTRGPRHASHAGWNRSVAGRRSPTPTLARPGGRALAPAVPTLGRHDALVRHRHHHSLFGLAPSDTGPSPTWTKPSCGWWGRPRKRSTAHPGQLFQKISQPIEPTRPNRHRSTHKGATDTRSTPTGTNFQQRRKSAPHSSAGIPAFDSGRSTHTAHKPCRHNTNNGLPVARTARTGRSCPQDMLSAGSGKPVANKVQTRLPVIPHPPTEKKGTS